MRAKGSHRRSIVAVARDSLKGRLPDRYAESWEEPFDELVRPSLKPEAHILDVGSGWKPTIPRDRRPPGCVYVGMDVSAAELERAGKESYDEIFVSDVTRLVPELQGRFDLIVSTQVLEHVKPLETAIENLRSYLRPSGRVVLQFSGRFSAFALVNRLLPARLSARLASKLVGRRPENVFKAYYDRCWYSALRRLLDPWSHSEIRTRFLGASYFDFSRLLRALYLVYEEWAFRGGHGNLATYYIVAARK